MRELLLERPLLLEEQPVEPPAVDLSSMMYGISGYPSASTSSTSAGSAADDDLSAPVDEKVR